MERVYTQMHPVPEEEWSELELTMPQFRALVLLRQGPRRMSEISSHLGTGLSSATSMVDRLLNKGLVEREHDPDDRRVVTCQLTAVGQAEVERFWRIGRTQVEGLAAELPLDDLTNVVHAMEILASAAARQRAKADGVQSRSAAPRTAESDC
ncbi:MAG: MarR family transcriptional regulator [Chloroflexi bacterium]|nr:MarR family transcriptional regulator [Chloroflexota bacterium]